MLYLLQHPPSYYCFIYLSFSAVDDIPHADETRTLIKDIWDLRISKLRSSVDTFVKSDATHAKVRFLLMSFYIPGYKIDIMQDSKSVVFENGQALIFFQMSPKKIHFTKSPHIKILLVYKL